MHRPLLSAAVLVAGVTLFAACASSTPAPATDAPTDAPEAAETTAPEPTSDLSGDLVIFAAASLGTAFDEIAVAFEELHPGVDVQPIRYDGSSTLATQIIEGAAVDVFASADENNMAKVTDASLATGPALFATNTLVIATPQDNPAGIAGIADLASPDASVVLCAVEVPCGAASQKLLDAAGVAVTPASLEQNVTAVLTKVEAGEADAGLVYATDVVGKGVASIVPEGAADVVNKYPLVALDDAPNPEAAQAFVEFVLSAEGQAILAALGFGAP
ncbi:molybdate ABC transporter substrate-binding protein [Microbacterium sp. No. 7]|uniref:molybdate ABC transporter substrate-binding protein n=1 Tax=Microbacterium sp. No. 7 TaxID=1714373 RepID=UPI0006D2529A|nr:molybdate ABC transporter substrate-binding protein [Microbacterium sp. No. 7]ALJ22237.1 molybdate-binding protein [Microbacterium sp. No. 7]